MNLFPDMVIESSIDPIDLIISILAFVTVFLIFIFFVLPGEDE